MSSANNNNQQRRLQFLQETFRIKQEKLFDNNHCDDAEQASNENLLSEDFASKHSNNDNNINTIVAVDGDQQNRSEHNDPLEVILPSSSFFASRALPRNSINKNLVNRGNDDDVVVLTAKSINGNHRPSVMMLQNDSEAASTSHESRNSESDAVVICLEQEIRHDDDQSQKRDHQHDEQHEMKLRKTARRYEIPTSKIIVEATQKEQLQQQSANNNSNHPSFHIPVTFCAAVPFIYVKLGLFSDIVLKFSSTTFTCHRVVLASSSKYFFNTLTNSSVVAMMSTGNQKPDPSGRLTLDCTHSIPPFLQSSSSSSLSSYVESVLKIMYQGWVPGVSEPLDMQTLLALLWIGELWQIGGAVLEDASMTCRAAVMEVDDDDDGKNDETAKINADLCLVASEALERMIEFSSESGNGFSSPLRNRRRVSKFQKLTNDDNLTPDEQQQQQQQSDLYPPPPYIRLSPPSILQSQQSNQGQHNAIPSCCSYPMKKVIRVNPFLLNSNCALPPILSAFRREWSDAIQSSFELDLDACDIRDLVRELAQGAVLLSQSSAASSSSNSSSEASDEGFISSLVIPDENGNNSKKYQRRNSTPIPIMVVHPIPAQAIHRFCKHGALCDIVFALRDFIGNRSRRNVGDDDDNDSDVTDSSPSSQQQQQQLPLSQRKANNNDKIPSQQQAQDEREEAEAAKRLKYKMDKVSVVASFLCIFYLHDVALEKYAKALMKVNQHQNNNNNNNNVNLNHPDVLHVADTLFSLIGSCIPPSFAAKLFHIVIVFASAGNNSFSASSSSGRRSELIRLCLASGAKSPENFENDWLSHLVRVHHCKNNKNVNLQSKSSFFTMAESESSRNDDKISAKSSGEERGSKTHESKRRQRSQEYQVESVSISLFQNLSNDSANNGGDATSTVIIADKLASTESALHSLVTLKQDSDKKMMDAVEELHHQLVQCRRDLAESMKTRK